MTPSRLTLGRAFSAGHSGALGNIPGQGYRTHLLAEKARGQPLGAAGPRLKYSYGDLCITPHHVKKQKPGPAGLSTAPKGYKRRSVL